jgi:hypothetical protein
MVLRSELEAWAPRPVHLTDAERREEIQRAADLYQSGHTIIEIAAMLTRCSTTIMAYLDEAGVGRTRGPRSRFPKPEPRECKRDGCSTVFTPEAWRVARGEGEFCSGECRLSWFVETFSIDPVYPDPGTRQCESCGSDFRPPRANAARGFGRFCSDSCAATDRWERKGGGNLDALVFNGSGFTGRHRQRWLGRWRGAPAGDLGGRPRSYTEDDIEKVRAVKERNPKLGRAAIARITGLTEPQVRSLQNSQGPSMAPVAEDQHAVAAGAG